MKELLRKKSVKISLLLIILLIVVGLVGINVRSVQKNKEYEAHIEAAEKYLSDLDYEQAIAEYTKALEIDPKEEVVEALEHTYLAYAQTYIDIGDYDKAVIILNEGYEKIGRESLQKLVEALEQTYLVYAQTYIDMGDYDKAVSILEEGYEKIKWESFHNKIVEVTELQEEKRVEEEKRANGMVEFPFRMSDITVMGYDLFGDHFEQIQALYPVERSSETDQCWNGHGTTSDGWLYNIHIDYDGDSIKSKEITVDYGDRGDWGRDYWRYKAIYSNNGSCANVSLEITNYNHSKRMFDDAIINVPITVGENYEDWCRVMQIDRIKESDLRPEERDGQVGIWSENGGMLTNQPKREDGEYWLFSMEGGQGIYSEFSLGNGTRMWEFSIGKTGIGEERPIDEIRATIVDGVIESVCYYSNTW